ncbi:hypothetical protein [Altererythrobacter sp. CC-YST694]|uniref:hypothetical protein n=1 Tax=Altererythrobacter sp. CC-YST694 TaxID=2755038 RepID=UPI001D033F69|nr:hypothetical protein [Altererythrobacter sp. CC-YST694]
MTRTALATLLLASSTIAAPAIAQEPTPSANAAKSERLPRVIKERLSIPEGEWTGPRLADGQPDVSGFWSNMIANHNNFTDPQAGAPGEPTEAANLPRDQRAPSRVSDPEDGQVPYLPEARVLQQDFAENFANPTKSRYIEPMARCAPAGVPKSLYWHGYEIRQYPGYVVFLFDTGTRIIRLGDAKHIHPDIKLWNGDSIGHWEGNTLVVDVTNNNGKALFGRTGDFMSENATVAERYVFAQDGASFNYVATFTDPTVYSRPWTATVPTRRYTAEDEPDGWHYDVTPVNNPGQPRDYEMPERICVENNGPFGGGAIGVVVHEPLIQR